MAKALLTMNSFFVNIGSSVEAKIPIGKKKFHTYLKNKNPNSVFFQACDQLEISPIINGFNRSKSCGPFSIPTKILK